MSITTFTKVDHLLAVELEHQVTHQVSPAFASIITNELGTASYTSPQKTVWAWYARAFLEGRTVPFALRCDVNGNWSVSCAFKDQYEFAEMVRLVIPAIEIVELPQGRNRAA